MLPFQVLTLRDRVRHTDFHNPKRGSTCPKSTKRRFETNRPTINSPRLRIVLRKNAISKSLSKVIVMRHWRISTLVVALTAMLTAQTGTAQPLAAELPVLVSPLVHAKAMPSDFNVPAMCFTGPSADGRRGSAGFVVPSREVIDGTGTRWQFTIGKARTSLHRLYPSNQSC